MADAIVIEGVRPWDGRYPFDLEQQELTTREWGYIKRLTGYLPLKIEEGLRGADPELFAVFAVIAMARAGKIERAEVDATFDRLLDAPFGSAITLDMTAAEVEPLDDPPASSSANGGSSGHGSTPSSETWPALPRASGTVGWDSSASPPAG